MPRARKAAGLVYGIGIGKQQEASAGSLRAGPAGVGLAGEASLFRGIERRGLERDHAAELCGLCQEVSGAVGGAVVHQDQLPVLSEFEARLRLPEQRFEARRKRLGLIACRHDDGKLQRWSILRFRFRRRFECDIVHDFVL